MLPRLSLALLALVLTGPASAAERTARGTQELRAALARLQPGDTLSIAPGEYPGGFDLRGVKGTAAAPIVIRGSDSQRPPVFSGGSLGLMVSGCAYVTLRGISVRGARGNGINIDNGGALNIPAHHIVVEDVTITDIGPQGNCDGLKMSGIDDFVVRRCRFEGWGGSAIDMVGCHRGVVEDCRFTGKEGFSQANAVQMKGGSSDILVQTSLFHQAGQRAINLGGSTRLQFFRPQGAIAEATRITVAGNRFFGSPCPVAFVSADGGRVYRNTMLFPERWIVRILQEQQAPGFKPCRGGVFEENLVVFDRRVVAHVNVGGGTAPETFTFRRNAWFRTDGTARPQLPTPEQNGIYQLDPRLDRSDSPAARITSQDPRFRGIGADAYQPAPGK